VVQWSGSNQKWYGRLFSIIKFGWVNSYLAVKGNPHCIDQDEGWAIDKKMLPHLLTAMF
jgi:hypothetical protein